MIGYCFRVITIIIAYRRIELENHNVGNVENVVEKLE